MKAVTQSDKTHNPFDEIYRVSCLRENLTSSSNGEGLETGRRSTLNGHAGGNPGYSQGRSYELPRQSFTRQLNFRHIKTTLGMELLRTKTPEMAKKEVLIYMLAYNLIRSLIWAAKQIYHIDIQRISFKGTVQHLSSLAPYLAIAGQFDYSRLYEELIHWVADEKVPDRPGRIEPRVLKRRPKPYPLMTQPRSQLKAKLAA